MDNIGKKYLPIGTVVLLKGGTKRLMIMGFCPILDDKNNIMYDYSGCMYPEGVLSSEQIALFNHEQIEKIDYMGFSDEEEKIFKTFLDDFVNKNLISNKENVNNTGNSSNSNNSNNTGNSSNNNNNSNNTGNSSNNNNNSNNVNDSNSNMNNVNISLGTFNNISKSLVPEVTNSFDNSNI